MALHRLRTGCGIGVFSVKYVRANHYRQLSKTATRTKPNFQRSVTSTFLSVLAEIVRARMKPQVQDGNQLIFRRRSLDAGWCENFSETAATAGVNCFIHISDWRHPLLVVNQMEIIAHSILEALLTNCMVVAFHNAFIWSQVKIVSSGYPPVSHART